MFVAKMLKKELKCLKYTVLFHKYTKEKRFRVRHPFWDRTYVGKPAPPPRTVFPLLDFTQL